MGLKAFELVPAIERLNLMSDKAQTKIECLECCGKDLYIGTNDCFIIRYNVKEGQQATGKIIYNCTREGHKYLALKKPVVQIKTASALNRILVLCDNTIFMLNMNDLEIITTGNTKIKNVSWFCTNPNPIKSNPFSIEIAVALRKKSVQLFTVTEDRIIPTKEISIPEPAVVLGMDGTHVCLATNQQYMIVNSENNRTQDLFPFSIEHTNPYITCISKEEFLLSAPSALGMFATSSGISQRPPLQWNENLVSVAYNHPYILALSDEFITVHSIIDQQQKQSVPFQGGVYLGEFDGRLFVASSKQVYALVPIPFEKQIQGLLEDKRVNEALDLAKNAHKIATSRENFTKLYQRIQQQAGFIELAEFNFDAARDLFRAGRIDVREIITLYPHMMPSMSTFSRCVPPLHEFADINQLSGGDKVKVTQFKEFLLAYLEGLRNSQQADGCRAEIDTALLKLYAELSPNDLMPFILSDNKCDVGDCESWLQQYGHHHAMALLYRYKEEVGRTLEIWFKLINGEVTDVSFPGLSFVAEFLANLPNEELVWKYVDQVLQKDQKEGVKVFTDRPHSETPSERMQPDVIVDYLARYPKAVIAYLEFIVFTKNIEKEKFHTHLAVLYLDQILELKKNQNVDAVEISKARSKFQRLLEWSTHYRVQMVLGKIKTTDLYSECAILYSKLEEHEKALNLLVHKLSDYGSAEKYCLTAAKGHDRAYRRRLFQTLLNVYLDPSNDKRDHMVAPAVSLLNSNLADFDAVKVLQSLPDNWSVGLVSQFLINSVRNNLHTSRMTKVERNLAKGENLNAKKDSVVLMKENVNLTEDRVCSVCNAEFTEPVFVRYPNGIVTHPKCGKNKYVCPVTGRLFSTGKK